MSTAAMLLSHSPIPISTPLHSHRLHHPSKPRFPFFSCFNPISPETSKPSSNNVHLKVLTPPWIKGPLSTDANDVLDLATLTRKSKDSSENRKDCVFTGKYIGKRGNRDVKRIAQCLEKLQEKDVEEEIQIRNKGFGFEGILEKLEWADDSFGSGAAKMPWDKVDGEVFFRRTKKEKVVTKAEMSLERGLLERLRNEARWIRKWIKVKKTGVTQVVVDEIRSLWRNRELVMVKFDVPLCCNMDRAQEIIETKTGGFVVWTYKDSLVVYRGSNYQLYPKNSMELHHDFSIAAEAITLNSDHILVKSDDRIFPELREPASLAVQSSEHSQLLQESKEGIKSKSVACGALFEHDAVVDGSLYQREADRLLEGLGPRYADWWMSKPLPVDGDLLPEVIPGYKPPPRRRPPNGKSSITDYELTYLRKLARPLPTHFVLGRNRKLQGLASAVVKLWEKTHIVKIAIKWGALNTNNKEMACELKSLTGGVLVLRNKFLIILYRGKDFLPPDVANLVMDRDTELQECQLHEEDARLRAMHALNYFDSQPTITSAVGTLTEHQTIRTAYMTQLNGKVNLKLEAEKQALEKHLRNQEHKLYLLHLKIKRSAEDLLKLNSKWSPANMTADAELITEEERECLLKIALKMSRSLVLGRRGVFDGVIEGIHQHWKYREVVKVITMQRSLSQIINTATMLEAETGGVLISVQKVKKGHAIVLYRGKNYKRPALLDNNLLTKREALQRSIEMQRLGSFKFFASQRQQKIADLRSKLQDIGKVAQDELQEKSSTDS